MMDLDIGIISEVEKKQKKKLLLEYLCDNLTYHNWWAYRYYLCEVLALLNVIGEVAFPDWATQLTRGPSDMGRMQAFLSDRGQVEVFRSDAGRIGILRSDRRLDEDILK
jgi:hypothetical protein